MSYSNHDMFGANASQDNLRTTPQKQIFTSSMMKAPSSATFNFNRPSNGTNIFDTHSNHDEASRENVSSRVSPKLNTNFYKEVEMLRQRLYSTKLSNNVLSEFDERYQKEKEKTNILADPQHVDSLTSHNSYAPRYNTSHKSKFNKMESISSHYAARRKEQQKQAAASAASLSTKKTNSRLIIEGNDNDNSETPFRGEDASKRTAMKELSSSKKRLRKLDGSFKEINESPTNKQTFTLLTSQSKLTTASAVYEKYGCDSNNENKAPVLNPSLLPPPPQPQFEPTKINRNTLKKPGFSSHSLQKSSAYSNLHNILESNKSISLKATSTSIPAPTKKTSSMTFSNSENERPSALSSFTSKPSCIPQPKYSKPTMTRSTTMQDISPNRLNSSTNRNSSNNQNSKLKLPLVNSSTKENYSFGKSNTSSVANGFVRSATSSNIPRLSSSNLATNQNSKNQARPAWRV